MIYHILRITSFFLFLSSSIVAQKKSVVHQSPFDFEASYVGDALANFSGGIQKGATYLGLANLKLSFDTEKAGFWKGGLFYIDAANTHGGTPSEKLIGDFQIASNIEAGNLTYVHELWFSQDFGKLSTIFGVQDLNVQFASSELAGNFLNSSFGVHSTISNNIPSPIFPLTALGWQFQYEFSDQLNGKIAIFDGLPEGYKHKTHNLSWKLDPNEGYLLISEFSFKNSSLDNRLGTYKIGAYYHNHYDLKNTSDSISAKNHENYGAYLVADQVVYNDSEGRELSFFAQASMSPKSKNTNSNYLGLGLNYKGLFKYRTEDILGLAMAHAGFKNSVFSNETTLEVTYKTQLTEHLFVQPDIQFVIHPAGTDKKLKNSLVGIVRFGLNF